MASQTVEGVVSHIPQRTEMSGEILYISLRRPDTYTDAAILSPDAQVPNRVQKGDLVEITYEEIKDLKNHIEYFGVSLVRIVKRA